MPLFFRCTGLTAILGLFLISLTCAEEVEVDFQTQIAPIFEKHCLSCHSDNISKGDFSLSSATDLADNEFVIAGDPNSSHLLDLVSGESPEMPKEGEPLSEEQLKSLSRWIESGAAWPDGVVLREASKGDKTWWSLQRISTDGSFNSIDEFILENLESEGLAMNEPADRGALFRRATYDLTGLPPSPSEVASFVEDPGEDAYERLLDRLLGSEHYGQRWGRHWLDVVRFGESNGYERNAVINDLWPFRDYVIESLNDDKPFNQFIREHIAGDVIAPSEPNVEIGSAFLVAGPYDDVNNQDATQVAQIRANTIDEMIRSTSQAFLGLTVGCARCHDHKFDAISQKDYYQLYAGFAGVRHGRREIATQEEKQTRREKLKPLNQRMAKLTKKRDELVALIEKLADQSAAEYQKSWTREKVQRTGTEERFEAVEAKFVRLIGLGADVNPKSKSFRIDEFEVWSPEACGQTAVNVALADNGGKARGASRVIEDFPGAYGPQLAIDGKYGARFISASSGSPNHELTIELAEPTEVDRVLFSSARDELKPDQPKFVFVSDYRIEVSLDAENWTVVADGADRKSVNEAHRKLRLFEKQVSDEQRKELGVLNQSINSLTREINAVPKLRKVWVGNHVDKDGKGPFHVFVGGSPQRKGEPVTAASLSTLELVTPAYRLDEGTEHRQRRLALADWIVHPENPLTPRVLANRLWHYHFGIGIVSTPSDFGYMGGSPSHGKLLDWLAAKLIENDWKLKPMHKTIMMSQAYRQSSRFDEESAARDGDNRLLWRFSPRRLSAEEIRDTMLSVAGVLEQKMGGPGFRLYRYLQDNVATYVPLDVHGRDTYRRAVYHQNARASRTDLMTEFDQPDCAFSTSRRAETTTPLQALTALNHSFTIDMAGALAKRLEGASVDRAEQVRFAFGLCYGRSPTKTEFEDCVRMIDKNGLAAFCRVLLNTSELIYVL